MKIKREEYQELLDAVKELNDTIKLLTETLKCMRVPIDYPPIPVAPEPYITWTYSKSDPNNAPIQVHSSKTGSE